MTNSGSKSHLNRLCAIGNCPLLILAVLWIIVKNKTIFARISTNLNFVLFLQLQLLREITQIVHNLQIQID